MASKENGQDGQRDTKKLLFVPPGWSGRRGNIWFVGVKGIRGLLTQLTALHRVSASVILSVPSASVSFLCVCFAVTQDKHQPVIKNGDSRGSSSAEQVSQYSFRAVFYVFCFVLELHNICLDALTPLSALNSVVLTRNIKVKKKKLELPFLAPNGKNFCFHFGSKALHGCCLYTLSAILLIPSAICFK